MLFRFEFDADLIEQHFHGHLDRLVDHHAQRPLLGVFADIGEGFGEIGIGHGWHGDQEMVGQIDVLHAAIILQKNR